ncbi:MAG TPA: Gfo/Idh/MocA family oxidoreductase [Propionibacteriaceae bacterium]|nr:Gfo/Idh/MocA family oxidoreductase [Propionibacteriaceae bacterium]
MTIRWGIAGTGRMAGVFAEELRQVPDCHVTAIGSRDHDRAYAFAADHSLKTGDNHVKAHGSYLHLVHDPDVDVVYIATPHPQHKAIALAAIDAGKAVLVEKAFTATLAGAQEVVAAARARGVFAMEGMWMRFQPVVAALRDVIGSGRLGELIAVQGDLFSYRRFDPADRLFSPDLGGGAVLDLGPYIVSFAQMLLGDPVDVEVRGTTYLNGVDASASFLLTYPSGASSTLMCSLSAEGPGRMAVIGTRGWAEVHPRFHHPTRFTVHRQGVLDRDFDLMPMGRGYTHEIIEVNRCLTEGQKESPVMPLDDTLSVMTTLQQALEALGNPQMEAPLS